MDEKVIIKFVKTHPDAKLPLKAYSDGDNCFDLFCVEDTTVPAFGICVGTASVPVGLQVAFITKGFGFVIKDKSGLGFKHNLSHFGGEIDNNYRGDMAVKIANYSAVPYEFKKGDKVAQIKVEKIWDTDLSFTDVVEEAGDARGAGGFGSSGKQ